MSWGNVGMVVGAASLGNRSCSPDWCQNGKWGTNSGPRAWSCDLVAIHFKTTCWLKCEWRPMSLRCSAWTDVISFLSSVIIQAFPWCTSKNTKWKWAPFSLLCGDFLCFCLDCRWEITASPSTALLFSAQRCHFSEKETSWHWQATGEEGHSSLFPLIPCDFFAAARARWSDSRLIWSRSLEITVLGPLALKMKKKSKDEEILKKKKTLNQASPLKSAF